MVSSNWGQSWLSVLLVRKHERLLTAFSTCELGQPHSEAHLEFSAACNSLAALSYLHVPHPAVELYCLPVYSPQHLLPPPQTAPMLCMTSEPRTHFCCCTQDSVS